MASLNYKHLHYFWTVAKAGSISQASKRLHITPQTISGQLSLFETVIGEALFNRTGRRFELTERGKVVLAYADEIFSLGLALEEILRSNAKKLPLQFKVGVCDSVPKSIAYQLISPALKEHTTIQIICKEGNMSNLLSELAVHKLDIVIADSAMPPHLNVRAFNHLLGECGLAFFATAELAAKLMQKPFPKCLHGAPMLLPGADDAVRPPLMRWLNAQHIQPNIIGEFDDGALMKVFGEAGAGVFAAPASAANRIEQTQNVVNLGFTKEVTKKFYAISVERHLTHPAVVTISNAAKQALFL